MYLLNIYFLDKYLKIYLINKSLFHNYNYGKFIHYQLISLTTNKTKHNLKNEMGYTIQQHANYFNYTMNNYFCLIFNEKCNVNSIIKKEYEKSL